MFTIPSAPHLSLCAAQREVRSHLTSVRNEASSHRVASEILLNKLSQNLGIRPASP